MSLNDSVNYLLFKNPVSKATISGVNSLIQSCGIKPKTASSVARPAFSTAQTALSPPLWKAAGGNYIFVRVAAVAGASAVCLAAYGKHKLKGNGTELQSIWESANNMHLIHSVVLLVVPFTKRPVISGSLFIVGTALFSGTCYYKAIRKSQGVEVTKPISHLAPYGGVCLILGWLSLLL